MEEKSGTQNCKHDSNVQALVPELKSNISTCNIDNDDLNEQDPRSGSESEPLYVDQLSQNRRVSFKFESSNTEDILMQKVQEAFTNPHRCELCRKEFYKAYALKRHIDTYHEDPNLTECPREG